VINTNRSLLLFMMIVFGLLLSACSIDLDRNADGSLTATTTITGEELEQELELALDNNESQVQNIDLTLQEGYIDVAMERARADSGQIDTITYTMELGGVDGRLGVTLSNAMINGQPAEQENVERWSERINNRLTNYHNNHENRTLESVDVSPSNVTMVWHVETRYSQGE
jgi:hypothetical protein